MPDGASELRDLVMAAVDRMVNQMQVQQAWEFAPGSVAPGNPFGGIADVGQEVQFSTGFDGINTVTPFILDFSALDGPDVLI